MPSGAGLAIAFLGRRSPGRPGSRVPTADLNVPNPRRSIRLLSRNDKLNYQQCLAPGFKRHNQPEWDLCHLDFVSLKIKSNSGKREVFNKEENPRQLSLRFFATASRTTRKRAAIWGNFIIKSFLISNLNKEREYSCGETLQGPRGCPVKLLGSFTQGTKQLFHWPRGTEFSFRLFSRGTVVIPSTNRTGW